MPQAVETGRQGEGETRRRGDEMRRSPCLLVSPSPCLLVLSLCLCLSVANSSAQAQPAPAQNVPAIKDPAARVTEALAGAVHVAAEIIAIKDPASRAAALQKLFETGVASEQIQAAREAVVTKW